MLVASYMGFFAAHLVLSSHGVCVFRVHVKTVQSYVGKQNRCDMIHYVRAHHQLFSIRILYAFITASRYVAQLRLDERLHNVLCSIQHYKASSNSTRVSYLVRMCSGWAAIETRDTEYW